MRERYAPDHETAEQRAERLAARFDFAIELRAAERLRPRTRGDCKAAREALVAHLPDDDDFKKLAPCIWASCRYHLLVDVDPIDGEITMFPLGPTGDTCILDIAERDGAEHDELANVMAVSVDRTRFIERRALAGVTKRLAKLWDIPIDEAKMRVSAVLSENDTE